jgi:hypothetical protein
VVPGDRAPVLFRAPAAQLKAGGVPLAAPAQGTIRLDLSNLSLAALLALIHVIRDGLNGNEYYTDLTAIVAALTASESTLLDLLDTLASLEQQVKTIRAALATAMLDGKEKLRAAAVACENTDRSDEALVSVGWPLRRSPGPAATMPPPTRLTARSTGFTGELSARWSAVPDKRFYEVQATPVDGDAVSTAWEEIPSRPISRGQIDLTGYTPGSLVGIRVRAVGAKGAGPWCDPITARV